MKRTPETLIAKTIATFIVFALSVFAVTHAFAQAPEASPSKSHSSKVSAKAPKAPKSTRAAKPAFEGKLALNTATAEQFEKLPRVGPKLAQRIVEYRNQHKSFRNVDELRNVKGVGAKMLESLKPFLTL
jgi:competence protein ComEA